MSASKVIAGLEAVSTSATALGSLAAAACQVKTLFWDSSKRKAFPELADDIHALNKELDQLIILKNELENEIAFESYKDWSHRVLTIDNEVKHLLAKYENQISGGSSSSSSSNFQEDFKKMHGEVINLLQEGNEIRDVIFQSSEPSVKKVRDVMKYKTLRDPLEKILDWLNNDEVKGVRIQGKVGIGKTTIMLNLIGHQKIAKFDIIIWLTVAKEASKENFSMEVLQRSVVQKLRLKVDEPTHPEVVAQRISMALKGKKYLLLLDDVKKDFKLDGIGIPYRSNGSKIVLTTRFRHACSSLVNKEIELNSLTSSESWAMFKDVLGNDRIMGDPKIERLAWRVCKECHGVPLFIEKVASTFKLKSNEYFWSRGLNSWRLWPEKEQQGIKEVYRMLKFCFDELDDEQKKCFLYVILYPRDATINADHLLECWEAEDFTGSIEMHVSGHHVLSHLKNVSLLEESKMKNHVVMHRFIREMALYVVEKYSELRYLVKASCELQKPPSSEFWNDKNGISLSDNDLKQLLDCPASTRLSTLFLQQNLSLKMIHSSFFERMRNLHILDLSRTGIILLPSSTSMLGSLRNLYLNDCKFLKELPSDFGEINRLETLDIRGSRLSNVPPQVEDLIFLKRLRVSFTKFRSSNASQEVGFNYSILSKLHRLEELVIDMKSPEEWSSETAENVIRAVASLENLKILKFCFLNKVVNVIEVISELRLHVSESEATILQSFIEKHIWREDGVKPFRILINCQNSKEPHFFEELDSDRYIKFCNGSDRNFPVLDDISSLAYMLELLYHDNVKQLSDIGSLKQLRHCLVAYCGAMETVVGSTIDVVLPNLEDLYLMNLSKLGSICTGTLEYGSLKMLKTLVITSCPEMTYLFPHGVIEQLCEIRHLEIESCSKVVEVIAESDAVGNPCLLPKLKKVVLRKMMSLTSICETDKLEWPSLEELEIFECPNLDKLPFSTENAAVLKIIEAEKHWWEWDVINWKNQQVKDRLEKCFRALG